MLGCPTIHKMFTDTSTHNICVNGYYAAQQLYTSPLQLCLSTSSSSRPLTMRTSVQPAYIIGAAEGVYGKSAIALPNCLHCCKGHHGMSAHLPHGHAQRAGLCAMAQ